MVTTISKKIISTTSAGDVKSSSEYLAMGNNTSKELHEYLVKLTLID
jgi:hypothetical protein